MECGYAVDYWFAIEIEPGFLSGSIFRKRKVPSLTQGNLFPTFPFVPAFSLLFAYAFHKYTTPPDPKGFNLLQFLKNLLCCFVESQ
jgi:hypothetical protein